MSLQHQETTEPETSEVIRLAQQMYERDRAEQERQSSLAAAAEEVGIPPEYLTKATAQLKARRMVAPQQVTRRSPAAMLVAVFVSAAIAVMLLVGLFYLRAEVSAPATAIIEPPPPVEVPILPAEPMPPRVTQPAPPLPAPQVDR